MFKHYAINKTIIIIKYIHMVTLIFIVNIQKHFNLFLGIDALRGIVQ